MLLNWCGGYLHLPTYLLSAAILRLFRGGASEKGRESGVEKKPLRRVESNRSNGAGVGGECGE